MEPVTHIDFLLLDSNERKKESFPFLSQQFTNVLDDQFNKSKNQRIEMTRHYGSTNYTQIE